MRKRRTEGETRDKHRERKDRNRDISSNIGDTSIKLYAESSRRDRYRNVVRHVFTEKEAASQFPFFVAITRRVQSGLVKRIVAV